VTVLVDRPPALIHPVGLCVDTARRRLYWFDAEYHAVVTADYDGGDVVLHRFTVGVVNLHVHNVSHLSLIKSSRRLQGICPLPRYVSPENHRRGHLPAVPTLTQTRE